MNKFRVACVSEGQERYEWEFKFDGTLADVAKEVIKSGGMWRSNEFTPYHAVIWIKSLDGIYIHPLFKDV